MEEKNKMKRIKVVSEPIIYDEREAEIGDVDTTPCTALYERLETSIYGSRIRNVGDVKSDLFGIDASFVVESTGNITARDIAIANSSIGGNTGDITAGYLAVWNSYVGGYIGSVKAKALFNCAHGNLVIGDVHVEILDECHALTNLVIAKLVKGKHKGSLNIITTDEGVERAIIYRGDMNELQDYAREHAKELAGLRFRRAEGVKELMSLEEFVALNKKLSKHYGSSNSVLKMAEQKLVLATAYWLDSPFTFGQQGYFVGYPEQPYRGMFGGHNCLEDMVAEAARVSRKLSMNVDLNFEGLAKDRKMTLLLQPVQEKQNDYKSVEELAELYLSKRLRLKFKI